MQIIQYDDFQFSPPSKSSLFSTKKEVHPLPKTSLSHSIFLIFSCYFPFLHLPTTLLHLPQHAVSIGQQFLFILIIMIYMFLPLIAQETERRQENEKLLKALNDQFEIEKSHLKLMEDFETDQRKLEHDFNNQMMVVMGMMEMGEWMAAEDMLVGLEIFHEF